MQRKIALIYIMLCFISINCFSQNVKQIYKKGFINQKDFFVEIPFRYVNRHIYIEVVVSEKKYTFLFDTGCELTSIDLNTAKEINYKLVKEIELSGSSIKTQKTSLVELPNITISSLNFEKTYGMLQDLSYIEKIDDTKKIDGIIGNNLMRKAKWQIDYIKKVIRVSDKTDKFVVPKGSETIKLNNETWGLGYISVEIKNNNNNFIFDLGSSGKFTANHSFIKYLREKDTILQEKKQTFPLDKIKLGEIELKNTSITLEKNVSSLIGNAFFENYLLTIDWEKNILFLNQNTN